MTTDETHVIVDWIQPVQENQQIGNNLVVVKQPESTIWKIMNIVTPFLGGCFTGLISAYLIYHF
jgi:hypothetical protein